jgi:hypothetical protein
LDVFLQAHDGGRAHPRNHTRGVSHQPVVINPRACYAPIA